MVNHDSILNLKSSGKKQPGEIAKHNARETRQKRQKKGAEAPFRVILQQRPSALRC